MEEDTGFSLVAKHAGREHELKFSSTAKQTTLGDVLEQLCAVTELSPETVKLLGGGRTIMPSRVPTQSALEAGLKPGARVMVMGSKAADVTAVQRAREPDRLAGFEHEVLQAARRRARIARDVAPPPAGTKYTFGSYEVLRSPGLRPGPEEALKLLYRLASDRGIRAIMDKHRFTVGKLAEMPPEGLVGVSAVCVLGYNTNKGECIHLRLRTDDLQGFRKYTSIRHTLVHELTHNVWSDHDNRFKALCSQLSREVEQAQQAAGTVLDGPAFADDELAASPLHPAMAATATVSGKTLRQLAQQPGTMSAAARSGASGPIGTLQQVNTSAGFLPVAAAGRPTAAASPAAAARAGAVDAASAKHSPGSAGKEDGDDDVGTMYEHFDARTEELERQQQELE